MLTIDETAERLGCSISDVIHLRGKGRLHEVDRNRFDESEVEQLVTRKRNRKPREFVATDCSDLPADEDGKRGLHAFPDRRPDRSVNTLSDREARTPRERMN
jgi:hypothetical protein